jgi:DNA-binding transcriptional LysR family regulator
VLFGTSEYFVSSRLPEILRDFTRRHPGVDLELTVDLSATLNAQIDRGELDLVLAKRRTGEARGQLVWRDRLAWICGAGLNIDPQAPLPLILYAPPSLTRTVALEALERAGRAWRVVCTSGSLSGLRAAALAGLGITLHARSLLPEGMVEAPAALRLPDAGEVEFVVTTRRGARGPELALAETILANGDRLQAGR